MYKGSFWYPSLEKPKRLLALAMVLVMIPLHQSELVGLYDSTVILFGWLPAQLAYDIGFGIVGFGILVYLYTIAPEPPEKHAGRLDEPVAGGGGDD